MKTNMQTIYAVKIMAFLYKKNGPCTSTEISRCVGTSPEFVQNILSKLRKNKSLVETTMGAHGGYTLAKSPKEIKLSDIFEAVDDYPLMYSEKKNDSDDHFKLESCKKGEENIRDHFRLMQEEADRLFNISLEDLVNGKSSDVYYQQFKMDDRSLE